MPEPFLDFKLGYTLGRGAFGKVYKAVHCLTNRHVAIKFLMKRKIKTDQDKKRVKTQIQILKKIRHPNLLKLLQVGQTDESCYLVTQLVEGEQLFQKINRLGKLDQQSAAHYFMQLLDSVLYLQKAGICHRDIKPQNIIVRGNSLKLIDFGLGNIYQEGELLKTSCGSPCYAAPQMMSQKKYDPKKTQIWALGITLYAMLTGKLPFEHNSTSKLYKIMSTGKYEQIQGISSSLKSLLKAMIQPNPSLRIDIQDICSHVWVRSFNYNFHIATSLQWNNKSLQKVQSSFQIGKQELKKHILNKFGPQRVYYFLLEQNDNISHNGPLHLSLVFFSLKSAQDSIKNKYPNAVWNTYFSAEGQNGQIIKIKKITKNIYTLCFQNKQ